MNNQDNPEQPEQPEQPLQDEEEETFSGRDISDDDMLRADLVSKKHMEQLVRASNIHGELFSLSEGALYHSFMALFEDMDADKDELIPNDVLRLQSVLDSIVGHAMLLRGEIGSYLATE